MVEQRSTASIGAAADASTQRPLHESGSLAAQLGAVPCPGYAAFVNALVGAMEVNMREPAVQAAGCYLLWNMPEALEYESTAAPRAVGP